MRKIGIIVDAYSTGKNLPEVFARLGIDLVHVQSMKQILEYDKASFKPENFVANIIYNYDLNKLTTELQAYKPNFILAGCESGILLADLLAERMGLPGNNPDLSLARRDKGQMYETLKRQGIRVPHSTSISNLEQAKEFNIAFPNWPKIIKPIDSAGSEGVFKCQTFTEVEQAFNKLFGAVNSMGSKNEKLILQEYMDGKQYFVNTVSWDGKHYVTDIWYDYKTLRDDEGVVCDNRVLLASDSELSKALKTYTFECLDGLGVKFGPGHTEVILMNEEPVLVEATSRLQGTVDPKIVSMCTGQNQVSATALAYWDGDKFLQQTKDNYVLKKNAMVVYLISHGNFFLKNAEKYKYLYNLETYFSSINIPKNGDFIRKTIDLGTTPGIIYLADKSMQKLKNDYSKIRNWEKTHINKISRQFDSIDEYV